MSFEDFYEDVDHEDLAVFFPKEDLSAYEDPPEISPGLSPGHRILQAVDSHLPSPLPIRTMSLAASCLVEDLSLLFPQLHIELGRATTGNNEIFVPIICDLQIFNSKGICKFSSDCTRIPDSAILKGDVRHHPWYELLLEKISSALTDYTSAQLLVLGKTFSARTNFGFTIQPGGKQKVFTNFRLPRYEATVRASVPDVAFRLKNKIFYSGVTNPPSLEELLEYASEHFPIGSLSRPGANRVACSNAPLLEWVDRYLGDTSDCCFDGLFSPLGDRLKLTLVNNTDKDIFVAEGTEIATLSCSLR